jgi:hypothetical protein
MSAAGMVASTEHAERVITGWKDSALNFLMDYASKNEKFLAEDVVAYAIETCGVDVPPDNRAWGGIFNAASRRNLIIGVGYAKAKTSNNSPKTLWSKT